MKFIISISRSISFTPQETDSDTFPSKLIPIWIITEQVAVKKIISTMLLPPLLHQSIRLKFQFRQSRYSEILLGQVLFNSSYFCSRVFGLGFGIRKENARGGPKRQVKSFLFPTSIRRVSSAYENGWQLSNGGGKKREGGRGYLSPKLLQVSSQVIDSLLFCFHLLPSLSKFPNFLWRKNHFVFSWKKRGALVLFDWTMLDKEGNFLLASRGILYF